MTAALTPGPPDLVVGGFQIWTGLLDLEQQRTLAAEVAIVAAEAPFVRQTTPWGKRMTVGMTSAGAQGWTTDRSGYRYEPAHSETGRRWPAIPETARAVWEAVANAPGPPDSCLINHYAENAKMSLHRDDTERDFAYPVVSISLGDPATFRIGGLARKDPTRSVTLGSGDVVRFGEDARLVYHGVDRIKFGVSPLLPEGGRINLTLRKAG